MYDVLVLAEVLMQDYLHFDLFRREAALLECMFFVDELDRDDRLGLVVGYGFSNSTDLMLAHTCNVSGGPTYDA